MAILSSSMHTDARAHPAPVTLIVWKNGKPSLMVRISLPFCSTMSHSNANGLLRSTSVLKCGEGIDTAAVPMSYRTEGKYKSKASAFTCSTSHPPPFMQSSIQRLDFCMSLSKPASPPSALAVFFTSRMSMSRFASAMPGASGNSLGSIEPSSASSMSVSDAAEEVSPSPSSGTSSTASGTGRTVADAGVGAASGALPSASPAAGRTCPCTSALSSTTTTSSSSATSSSSSVSAPRAKLAAMSRHDSAAYAFTKNSMICMRPGTFGTCIPMTTSHSTSTLSFDHPMKARVQPAADTLITLLNGNPSSTVRMSFPFCSTKSPIKRSPWPFEERLFTSLTNAVKCGGGIVTDAPSGTAYFTFGRKMSYKPFSTSTRRTSHPEEHMISRILPPGRHINRSTPSAPPCLDFPSCNPTCVRTVKFAFSSPGQSSFVGSGGSSTTSRRFCSAFMTGFGRLASD
mmetsp:Transcript_37560/g.86758  ORF Transcript_37560/g.86758 Transcript_37560/m.86758 type:complete len:457 (-) Transcript_37560:1152-2522(-)